MDRFAFSAVLWDLDDTLYDRMTAVQRVFPGMFRQCLYPKQSEAFLRDAVAYMMTQVDHNHLVHERAFHALLERYPSDIPFVHGDCVDYYYAHVRAFAQPFPETVKILKKLKAQGVKLAIVTNITPQLLEHQHKKVDALGIAPLFDVIVYSAELGIHKPDRRIFDHAAACLGVPNAQCLFVGDDPNSDVAGALGAGMEVVWLDRWHRYEDHYDDLRVHKVKTLSEYFQVE